MNRPSVLVAVTLLLGAAAGPVEADADCVVPPLDRAVASLARTDHAVTGNRIALGCGPLQGGVTDVELEGTPAWVLPDPTDRGRSWVVVLEDGTVEHVVTDAGGTPSISLAEYPPLAPGHPPLAVATGADRLVVGSALTASGWFETALPDVRVTEIGEAALVALSAPTERYPHGVLGDGLEAAAVDVRDLDGLLVRIEVADHEVIEGTSAMVVELVPDSPGLQLLVTVSDADDGARLRVYDLDGEILAESEPIGQGFRWLHQVAVGPIGPEGELEIVAVRTPHIGGVVEAYRLEGDRLERVASLTGYSSHRIGSANLDMALLADATGDGRLEVVVPTQDMHNLALLARVREGFQEVDRLALEGELATNVAATPDEGGGLVLAAGTEDGRLRIFD